MVEELLDLEEDVKDDWLNIVKKHKKRQKGLPALSRLNTNAGNVEKNIELFNAMQPNDNITVDAANGNVSTGDCCAMGESLEENFMEPIILHYEDLPVTITTRRGNPSGRYDASFGNYVPDDPEQHEGKVDWNYEVDVDSMVEFLQDLDEVEQEIDPDKLLTGEEYQQKIEDNLDELVEKHMKLIMDHYRIRAIEDADENYDSEDDMYEREPYEESVKSADLDDKFDMSMRTLL